MIQIRQGLERLTADLTELRESMMCRPVDPTPYLKQLDKVVGALEAKSNKVSLPKPPLDADEVWAHWRLLSFDLSKLDARQIRTLCVSPKTAMKARLVGALGNTQDPLKRWINFFGFVQAYFGQWRTMENPESVEKLIHNMLSLGKISRKSKTLDLWRKSLFFFSEEASRRFGKIILKNHKSVQESCAEYGIDPSSTLASAAHEYAAEAAAEELVQRDSLTGQELALKELQWISNHLLTSALSPDAYRRVMSKLITSRMADGMPPLRSALVNLVLDDERLGDPRLAYCAPNWRKIPDARGRLLAWLAKEMLQLFFNTLVPRDDANRRRAEFWLEYAKKPGKIKDFQVAVSADDRPKIRATRAETELRYSSVTGGKTSAFLMIFEGYGTEYVVIEFSETNNAAYIYQRKTFEGRQITIRSSSFHLNDNLKDRKTATGRILHVDGIESWETNARRQLAELGIRP
ncbi:MAG: EH signature domain-containing protein [Formivibrio sp.]|nr:EH signature domain-containing protein [Formivibrio sp.]